MCDFWKRNWSRWNKAKNRKRKTSKQRKGWFLSSMEPCCASWSSFRSESQCFQRVFLFFRYLTKQNIAIVNSLLRLLSCPSLWTTLYPSSSLQLFLLTFFLLSCGDSRCPAKLLFSVQRTKLSSGYSGKALAGQPITHLWDEVTFFFFSTLSTLWE